MADKPVTREEKYLAYLTGDYTGEIPKPITRKEKYLYELCLKGIGGEISPEEIKNAVNDYLEKNPVKPGATTEQAQQIEQNKTNIASLKEDLYVKTYNIFDVNFLPRAFIPLTPVNCFLIIMIIIRQQMKLLMFFRILNTPFQMVVNLSLMSYS